MNEVLLNIVKRQETELRLLLKRKLVSREKTHELVDNLSSPLIKVILGPRRGGKSSLALHALRSEKFAYFNFEDEFLPQFEDGDKLIDALTDVYGTVDYYFFDEIQNFPRWEQFLNRLHRTSKNLIVTGSNSKLLGEELSTALTGRHQVIELLPFSFREASSASAIIFEKYLKEGGFPEIVLGLSEYTGYLAALWDAVILKDIAQRKKVRQVQHLRELLSLFLSSIGAKYSNESLTRAMAERISAPTVKKFLGFGSEAYLIVELMPYHYKPRLRFKSDRKAYTIDNGFYSAKNTSTSADSGRLFENIIFVELWRRGFYPNLDLFYYITRTGYEVDFLLRDGHKNLELIQVAYSLSAQKTQIREFRSIIQASKELNVKKLSIITLNEERTERIDGVLIKVHSAEKWLSEPGL